MRVLPEQVAWLERDWGTVTWFTPEVRGDEPQAVGSTLYVRDGQAESIWRSGVTAVAKSAETLNQVAHGLGLTWKVQW